MNAASYRRQLDALLEGIQIIDYDWRYVYLNDVMVQQAKASKEALLGYTMMEKFPGIEQTEMFGKLEACMYKRIPQRTENNFTYPDGTQRWFDLNIQPDEKGICILSLDITDYKRAQQQLVASEKRFRALIEKSVDMKTLADAEGKLLYASPSITKMLGYSEAEMIGASIFRIIHPDDIGAFLEKRKQSLELPGSSFNFTLRVQHKDGHWVWCEGNATNLLKEPGINALVSNFSDVSEKKARERQREFDQNNLHALINNTNDLLWSVDREFRLITSNKPFDETVTRRRGQPIAKGEKVFDDAASERSVWFRQHYERAFAGNIFTETFYSMTPNERWLEVSFHPIYEDGHTIGTACHTRDITERRRLEKQLEENLRALSDYRYALDEASIVAITDQAGIISHVNDNFCRISGYGREELIGQDYRIVNSSHHPKTFFRELWRTISKGKIWRGEIRNKAKDGSFYWVDTTIIPFLDENGRPFQYMAIRQDVTARKNAEEKLVRNNIELQKTNLELDRFVYSISHDLRAPLTSIMGLIAIIEEESNEPEMLEHVGMIRSRVERLDVFIKKILSYSRSSRTDVSTELIPLAETIGEVVDSLTGTRHTGNIRFEIDVDEKAPFCSDKLSFCTVVENLVSNAIKFTDPAKKAPFINISGVCHRDFLHLDIRDNGIGIAPEYHSKIFDMFFRLSGKTEGSGIGLYIVKEIVEKMEGTVSVASNGHDGTTFSLKIKNLIP
jgi:PAS domain S-box-containing protein